MKRKQSRPSTRIRQRAEYTAPRKKSFDSLDSFDPIDDFPSDMPTCRLLPHGVYTLAPAVLTAMAWLASLFQDGCDFARLTGDTVRQVADNPDVPFLEVGFGAYREPILNTKTGVWQVVYTGECFMYPDGTEDMYWQVARAFDFMALVLGGGGCFFLWFSTCCVFSRATWRLAGYEVGLAAIFQGLSFLWFQTRMCQVDANHCSLFWGSKADIVAASFWTTAAVLIFGYYPKPKERDGDGVFVEDANASSPTVRVSDGSLALEDTSTAVTAAAEVPVGSGDEEDHVEMSSGQSSRQESRRRKDEEMTEVEII